jgi:hypothetical protein
MVSMPPLLKRALSFMASNSFQPHLAGVLKDRDAIRVLKVFIQPHTVPGLP